MRNIICLPVCDEETISEAHINVKCFKMWGEESRKVGEYITENFGCRLKSRQDVMEEGSALVLNCMPVIQNSNDGIGLANHCLLLN